MMKTTPYSRILSLLCVPVLGMAVLNGCTTTDSAFQDSLSGKSKTAQQRLEIRALEAEAKGNLGEAETLYETLYLKNSDNPQMVANYAHALRKNDKHDRALIVLSSYIMKRTKKGEDNLIPAEIWQEYAAANAEMGYFENAEKAVVRLKETAMTGQMSAQAENIMGIISDAQGNHKQAEAHYQKAMESWSGNPSVLLNNLALAQANRGLFDRSLENLRKALALSPDRVELAQNIDLVKSLRMSLVSTPHSTAR